MLIIYTTVSKIFIY